MMLNPPPIVLQHQHKMQCWAAATESWLAANPTRRKYTQDQIVASLKEENGVRSDGALLKGNGQGIWELYFGLRPIRQACGEFSVETTLNRLKMRLPIMLGLEVSYEMGHVVVVFGAEINTADSKESFIVVMDPWSSSNYRKWKATDIQSKKGHVTTWLHRMPLLMP